MTDKDIIKALECCTGLGCDKCKFNDGEPNTCSCEWELKNAAMEVLQRQRAEIKRLTTEHDALIRTYKDCAMGVVKEFAAKLKERAYVAENEWSHGEHPMVVEVDDIDECVEEMEHGHENKN